MLRNESADLVLRLSLMRMGGSTSKPPVVDSPPQHSVRSAEFLRISWTGFLSLGLVADTGRA